MTETLLDVRYVSVTFPGRGRWGGQGTPVKAVSGVRFNLLSGEVLGLVGESGSGKTTLARVLAGLQPAYSGEVMVEGQDLMILRRRNPRELWRRVQYVFQDPIASLNPRRTIGQALQAPLGALLGLRGKHLRNRSEELLEQVGLPADFLGRYPHELSGGQAQRVAIARALAPRPRLLILDEPVSALDVSIQAQVLDLLRQLRNRLGLSYLFVSHDLAVVENLCDTVAVMWNGKLVEYAPREELFRQPQHPYTQRLLTSVPVPGRRTLVATRETPHPGA